MHICRFLVTLVRGSVFTLHTVGSLSSCTRSVEVEYLRILKTALVPGGRNSSRAWQRWITRAPFVDLLSSQLGLHSITCAVLSRPSSRSNGHRHWLLGVRGRNWMLTCLRWKTAKILTRMRPASKLFVSVAVAVACMCVPCKCRTRARSVHLLSLYVFFVSGAPAAH